MTMTPEAEAELIYHEWMIRDEPVLSTNSRTDLVKRIATALRQRDAEIERLKRIITAMLGRCADLLDDAQFNNIEALAEAVEPTFDKVTESLRVALAKAEQERNHWHNLYDGCCDDLGASLRQHEDTKAILSKPEAG